MSVSDGEKVNAAITNAAFMSRTVDDNTTGKKDLENVDAASGSSIFNIQKSINGAHSFQGADPNGVQNQTPSWTSDTIGTPNEAIKPRVDAIQTVVETNSTNISDNASDISDIRTTQGTSDGDTDLGTFTGSTISDNTDVKNALQQLETAVEAVGGALVFQGTWDASTNTPTLVSSTGTAGHFYIVSVAGSTNLDGITDWQINDWAVFNGGVWQKVDNTELVTSVNGQTGAVVLDLDDLNNVTEVSLATGDFLRWSGSAWTNSKELDISGTASATQRLVVSSDTTANLTSLARKAGAVYWSTDEQIYYGDDGTSLVALGSGGGGSGLKNYYDDYGDFEGATDVSANATLFNDPGGYADGTGGTVAGLSVAQHTGGSILVNSATLAITKAAVDSTDDGVTFLTRTIDPADYGRSLYGSFEIDATDANYTSLDLEVKAYDVTNSVELPVIIDSALTNQKGKVLFKVLPGGTTASIRVSLFLPSDSATGSAWTVYLDDLRLGPDQAVQTAIITPWEAFTPTGSWTSNVTYTGVKRRVGEELECRIHLQATGTPGPTASTTLTVDVPDSLVIDTTKLPGFDRETQLGDMIIDDGGSTLYGYVQYLSTTTVRPMYIQDAGADETGDIIQPNSTRPINFVNGDGLYLTFKVPIEGWSAGALLSTTETLFSTVHAIYQISGSSTNLSFADATFERVDYDLKIYDPFNTVTTGASWVFTAPKDGRYSVTSELSWNSSTNLIDTILDVYVNSVFYARPVRTNTGGIAVSGGDVIADLKKGDTIYIEGYQNDSASGARTVNSGSFPKVYIRSLPDFSAFGVFGETELIESGVFTTFTNWTITADQFGDLASITLTPGEWDIFGSLSLFSSGATTTSDVRLGISSTSGNSSTGLDLGDNYVLIRKDTTANSHQTLTVRDDGVIVTAPTTFYLKGHAEASITNLQYLCKISARRIK